MSSRWAYLVMGTALLCSASAGNAAKLGPRVFTDEEAEEARALARRECRALVVHFVPASTLGFEQVQAYYKNRTGIPSAALDDVVVVVIPTGKYPGFARQLGITEAGGFRAISAFDLGPVDSRSVITCRSGFV